MDVQVGDESHGQAPRCQDEETDIVMESRSQRQGAARSCGRARHLRGRAACGLPSGMRTLRGGCQPPHRAAVRRDALLSGICRASAFFPHGPRPARGRRSGPRGSSPVRGAGAGEPPAGIGRRRPCAPAPEPVWRAPRRGGRGQDAAAAQALPLQRGEQAGQVSRQEDAAEQAVMAQQAPGRMAEHGQRIRPSCLFPGALPGKGRTVGQGPGPRRAASRRALAEGRPLPARA